MPRGTLPIIGRLRSGMSDFVQPLPARFPKGNAIHAIFRHRSSNPQTEDLAQECCPARVRWEEIPAGRRVNPGHYLKNRAMAETS